MGEKYDMYSDFDVRKHKETFVNYLEVVICEDGKIMYANPSHQEALISLACKKLSLTRNELFAKCPQEYYFDFITWLCMESGACSVWDRFVMGDKFTEKQIAALEMLKREGVYKGDIPVR